MDPPWWYGQNFFCFRNKTFLFFKIERWNFQVQFEIGFPETSQNFNSFSFFRKLLFPFFFYQLSDWVEILWGFTKFNFKLNLKVSAFYLEKQKSFIPEKNIFLAVVNMKTKNLCLLTQFSRRFCAVYNSIILSSPLVLLSDLDLQGFCLCGFLFVSPH